MSVPELTEFARRKWLETEKNQVVFVHVHGNTEYSHDRVSAVIEAFGAAVSNEQEPVGICYLLRSSADVILARPRYSDAIRKIRENENEFEFRTFACWGDALAHDRQVLLFDGNRDTMSSLQYLAIQELHLELESKANEGSRCLIVSVAPCPDVSLWQDPTRLPVESFELQGEDFRRKKHSVRDWRSSAVQIIEKELHNRLDALESSPVIQTSSPLTEHGPTFVLLMRYDDAHYLVEQLKQTSSNVEFGCIMPWSDLQSIETATSRSRFLKLIYIDDNVAIMPLIEGSKILIGPTADLCWASTIVHSPVQVLDHCTGTELRTEAAFSLSKTAPSVHKFNLLCNKAGFIEDIVGPAWGSQVLHSEFCRIKMLESFLPIEDSVRPESAARLMSAEALRKMEVWGLVKIEETYGEPIEQLLCPMGTQAARFYRLTNNINSMVLLGCITEDMSSAAISILVDMAILTCQGPSTIFYPATSAAKAQAADEIRSLKGPFVDLVDKGQLWLSVACLGAYRNRNLTANLSSLLRTEVVSRVQDRTAHIRTWFGLERDDLQFTLLTPREVRIIERNLARAFLFNILFIREAGDVFAVDFTSKVGLLQAADDPLHRDKLHRDSDTPGVVAGIYTYMEATIDPDNRTVSGYRPHDVTVLSVRAVAKALREVGGAEALWPSCPPRRMASCVDKCEIDQCVKALERYEKEEPREEEMKAYDSPSTTI